MLSVSPQNSLRLNEDVYCQADRNEVCGIRDPKVESEIRRVGSVGSRSQGFLLLNWVQ